MKKTLIKVAFIAIVIGLVVWVGWRHFGQLERILTVNWGMFALLGGLFLIMRGTQAEMFRVVLRTLKAPIGYYRSFLLAMAVSLSNLIVPRIGMGAPAIYLKARHNLPYANFMSLLLPTVLLQLLCVGLVGLICQVWVYLASGQQWSWLLAGLLTCCILFSAAALATPVRFPEHWNNRIANFFRQLLNSWSKLRRNQKLLAYVFALQLVVLLVQAFRLWLCFRVMRFEVSIPAIILASFLGHLGSIIGYTPGGIGFRETAIAIGASLMHVDVESAVAAAVLDRAVMTACSIAFGSFAVWQLTSEKNMKPVPVEA